MKVCDHADSLPCWLYHLKYKEQHHCIHRHPHKLFITCLTLYDCKIAGENVCCVEVENEN